ncbi:MAG: hypothetical protein EOO38_07855 [Cytophagaceae bacterium]|nr:MAG: hypothetical protein EOO38_07855 [Cytophagaceae bacterium]
MKSFIQYRIFQASAIALLTFPIFSSAELTTASFVIQARYQQSCQIWVTPILDFGTITSNTVVAQTSDTLVVQCGLNAQTPFGVWAPLSINANGQQRRMKNSNTNANNYLSYDLYVGADGTAKIPTTSTMTGFTSPVNARSTGVLIRATIPTGQTLTQGYYTDDVILTVSY